MDVPSRSLVDIDREYTGIAVSPSYLTSLQGTIHQYMQQTHKAGCHILLEDGLY